ncbi:acetolactate synthase-1/2/3 large subunit [Lentibacillus halodurans]|uniref:Acetolactate synthase-1/2/3 large subunit n=1 Tax=Lentibacillus halodurans TaxID=237679 RepID=A0A1I0YV57_9BACI|nr:thiamine pyrophosphate-dependent enzyme [Lentibacillus halodurans]SFB16138.1 acetolactate synthase-1/2/3 large subunit [Lentibacillus halodurans]
MKTTTAARSVKTVTAARAIVECMKIEGISHTFCVPGESYLPLLDALHDEDSIKLVSARHESGAAFMAEGYAKSSLKPGVVMATRGVGASNLSIGVHTAYQDSTPMVVFLGQVHSKFRGREGFQEVDLDQYFQHIAKWSAEVKDPKRMPEIVQRAFRIAKTGRPGPVVVALPEDVLPAEAEMTFGPVAVKPRPAPANEEVRQVEELFASAEKPLIIAGGGVKSSKSEEALVAFAEKYHLPVMAAFRRQDVFPNDHPLYVGHLGLGTNQKILQTVEEADTILAIGTRLSEVTTQDYQIITPEKKLIHIDINYGTIGKVFSPDAGIVADAGEALKKLAGMDAQGSWKNWVTERRSAFKEVSRLDVSHKNTINKHIVAMMAGILPDNALLTNDAGNFAGWFHAYYPFKKKHTYVGPTSGAMGYGMPAALGAKIAYPDKPVIALSGDGGFMMTVQELETAVRYHIPVICLVFNNQMYGTIRMHQEMHYPEKVIGTDLGRVSFKDLASSIGADGYLANTPEQFAESLETALQKNVPAVIEVMTDQEQISVSSTITQIRDRAK